MTQTAEIVTFSLAADISTEAFTTLSQATESFVRAQPGFLHRQLSLGTDGRWTDYVIWADAKAAQSASEAFMQAECAAALMAAIQPDSVTMRHETVLWRMAA